jgi:uncharacterized protein
MQFSPLVFRDRINFNTICLFHSLTLQKFYCTQDIFSEIENAIAKNKKTKLIQKLIENNFIIEKKLDVEKLFEKISKNYPKIPTITCSYIVLTDKCNFHCKYCFVKKGSVSMKKKLADKVVEIIKRNAFQWERPYQIFFYGGEPLLNKETMFYLVRKLSKVKSLNFSFGINTNASLINRKIAKKFKKYNFQVVVSLDGWKEIHDQMRVYPNGKGTYYDTIRGLTILQEEGIQPGISCTVATHNYMQLPEVVEFFKRLGIKDVGFNILIGQKELRKKMNPAVLAYYFFEAFKKARELEMTEERIGARRYNYFVKEVPRPNDCTGGGEQIYFSPDGRIGPCHAFYSRKEHHIKIPRNYKNFIASYHQLWKEWCLRSPFNMKQCWGCEAISICGGGCPYSCFLLKGSIWKIDEYFCKFMKTTLKLLLRDYFFMNVLDVQIKKLSRSEIPKLARFVNKMKKTTDAKNLNIQKIEDDILWGVKGVLSNEYKDGTFFIAKHEGEIIGYCMLFLKKGRMECGIGVLPKYQNKGIGTKLLETVIFEAKRLDVKEIFAVIKSENEKTRKFFENNGFIVVSKENSKILMKKKI